MPKFRLKNLTNTITSFLSHASTVVREWTIPDKDGTIAMVDDIVTAVSVTQVSISGAATLTSTAFGKLHVLTGSSDYTVALPAASGNNGLTIGFVGANTLTATVTIDGNASETINGIIIRSITTGGSFTLVCDGTGWTVMNEIPSTISYTPTLTGFSATTVLIVSYKLIGKVLTLKWAITGTSDLTTFTMSFPPNMICNEYHDGVCRVANAGTAAAGRYTASAGTVIVTFNSSVSGGSFTASGSKQSYGQFTTAIQ